MEIAKPFIIRPNGRPRDYVVNPESDLFNATIEKRVQFVQGANTFVGIMLLYESIRYVYYYFEYRQTCSDYAYLVIAYLAGNFLWVITSFYGFGSIDTRNTSKIRSYHNLLIFVLVTRVFVYGMMAYVMDQYQNVFNRRAVIENPEELSEEIQDLVCTSVYQKGLMLIQCIIETAFLVMMIILSRQIRNYVRGWQQFENMKQISLPLINRH